VKQERKDKVQPGGDRPSGDATAAPTASAGASKPQLTQLEATLILARRGNLAVLPQLQRTLDEHPEIWQKHGNLGRAVEMNWIQQIAGTDLLVAESLTRQLDAMRNDLGGSTRLEKLIVERIVSAWLQVQYAEALVAGSNDAGIRIRHFYLRQLESAERRFHAACKSMALVRRLLGSVELRVQHTHEITMPPAPVANEAKPSATSLRREQLFGPGVPMLKEELTHV